MRDVSDPTYVAELVEFAESMLVELEGIGWEIFELMEAVHKAAVHKSSSVEQAVELGFIGEDLMIPHRKLANLQENLAELLDARPVPVVLAFEEVDG